MAYRIYSGTLDNAADRISLVSAGAGDSITFTRSAIYTAFGARSHVVSFKRDLTLAVDGQLASGSGATVSGGTGNAVSEVRVGSYGSVTSAGGAAFDIGGAGLSLYNRGEIAGLSGIRATTATTTIVNAGAISGRIALDLVGDAALIDNSGDIVGRERGIRILGSGFQQVVNSGRIVSQYGTGLDVSAAGDILIDNSGTISGRVGINLDVPSANLSASRTIVNTGTIAGIDTAIYGSAGDDTVRNDGIVAGEINLFVGNDTYDGSRGSASGRVFGDTGVDTLTGGTGRDWLDGGTGDDALAGGAGDDILVGGQGLDVLDGGDGRDIASYRTETANLSLSLAGGGDRTDVFTSIEGLEGGSGNDFLLGSTGRDWLYGSAGDDYIDGNSGSDILFGGAGDDTYVVDGASGNPIDDRVVERVNNGVDTVEAHGSYILPDNVENLTILGSFGANGIGNALANVFVGNDAVNVFDGLGGSDTFTGGGGADVFRFFTAPGSGNIETITDFTSGSDVIGLYRPIFPALSAGTLPASAFVVGTQAADALDRIIFDPASHALYYDPDGTGAAAQIQFAVVYGTAPVAADFLVAG